MATNNSAIITGIRDDKAPLITTVLNNGYTNDTTPLLQGSLTTALTTGETVAVYRDGVKIGTAKVSGTTWSYQDSGLLNANQYKYTVAIETSGVKGVESAAYTINIDTIVPDQIVKITEIIDNQQTTGKTISDVGVIQDGGITNDDRPEIKGTLSKALNDGESVVIYRNGEEAGTATVFGNIWTFVDGGLVNKEAFTYTAQVKDLAGNVSQFSNAYSLVLDTDGGSQTISISAISDNLNPVQGTVANYGVTNDISPTLTGALNTALTAGQTVVILRDGVQVGNATVSGKSWTYTDNLGRSPEGLTKYTAVIRSSDGTDVAPSNDYNIIYDPSSSGRILIKITGAIDNELAFSWKGKPDIGTLADGATTNDDRPLLQGTLSRPLLAGEKVIIYCDGEPLNEATVFGTNWTCEEGGLINHAMHTWNAMVVDINGNAVSNFSNSYSLTIDVDGGHSSIRLNSITDNSSGVGEAKFNYDTVHDVTPTLSGTFPLYDTFGINNSIIICRDGVEIGTATTNGNYWYFTDDLSYSPAGLTTYSVILRTIDGLDLPISNPLNIIYDPVIVVARSFNFFDLDVTSDVVADLDSIVIQDPATEIIPRDTRLSQVITITEIYDNKGPGIGVIAEGNVTNDDLPEIRGSLSQPLATGEAVYILRNGVEVGEATVTGTEWTFEDGGLGSRQAYTYTAIIKDIDGNIISTSNIYAIQTNFDDPDDFISINYVNDNVSPITGLVDHNGYTNDTTPTVEGVLKLSVSYDKLVVYRDGLEVGEATVQGDTWKFADDLSLSSQGEHKYQVKAFDGTTEVSTSNEFIINFDTVAPSATVTITSYHDDISPLTGDFLSNSSTNDTSPTLNLKVNGVIGSNESVYVYRDGQYIGKATLVSGSDYQFIDNSLEDGQTYTYTTRVVDTAGNEGAVSSDFNITVDLTPPPQPTAPTEYIDDIGSIQGTFGTDTVTDDTKPALKIGITDETPTLYVDGVKVAATYDPVEGTLTPVTALTDGSHDLSYTLTDAAGNESIESEAVTVIVDTVPPVQPVSPSEYIDNVDPLTGTFVTDTTTNDTTPSLIIGAVAVDETPTLYVDGQAVDSVYDAINGTLTPVSALGDGSHDLSYTLTDIAGNESLPSGSIAIIIDTIAPTANANIKNYIDDTGLITGEFLKDTITDDTSPTLNINVNAALGVGETVQIFRDGIYVGTAVEVANKKYQFTDNTSGLIDGKTYKYSACVIDTAGNQGKMSGNFKITIDLTPPDQPNAPTAYIDNVDPAQGTFASNTVTNDTTPSIIIDPLGADEISASLYINGVKVNAIYDIATNTLTPVDALPDGSYSVTYTVIDSTGIESQQSAPILFTVDTIAPDKPATPTHYYDNTGLVQGEFTVDTITDDTTPGIIIGQLPTGTSSMLFVDGKPVDAIYDPSTGYLTPIEPLTDGEHEFSYILLDQAKNQSAQSDPVVITISTKPDVSDVTTTFNLSVDTADGVNAAGYTSTITASNNDFITRDNTPEISGVLNRELKASEMLQVSEDGGVTWSDVTVLDSVKWKYISDAYSTDTILNYAFRVRDQFGSFSDILTGQDRRVVVDLTAPDALVMQPALSAKSDLNSTFTFTSDQYGKIEPGTKIAIVQDVNDNDMWQEGLDKIIAYAVADDQGQWTISTKLPAGDISVGFMLWDQAGNASALSPTTTTMVTASPNNAEVITTNWGGTTDGDGYGVNAAAVTINEDGSYSFWQSVRGTTKTNMAYAGRVYSISEDIYSASSSYLAEPSASYRKGFGGFVASAVFADINRDGYMDVMSQVSDDNDSDTTPYWINNGDGTYTGKLFNQGTTTHIGGVIAYDRTGDFYIDFVAADSCSDSLVFIKNNGGTLVLETTKEAYSYSEAVYSYVYKKVGCYYKYVQVVTYETRTGYKDVNGIASSAMTITNGLGTGSVTGKAMPKDLSLLHDIAAVDLDNNGTVDLVAHVDYNGGSSSAGDSSRGMGVLYNSGTAAGFTYINKANIFTNDGGTDYGNLPQTILFADFNGDGWLDMYLNRGSKGGVNSDESRIYLNDGKGQLNATDTQALWFGDKLAGGTAFAIDWNLDGKADIVEVPTQVAGSIQSGFAPTLYLNHGNNVWGSDAIALTGTKYSDITGAMAVDYDWDGAVDLVLSRAGADASVVASTNSASTVIVRNTNVAADGTSLHFKIVDSKGVNSFYGNTVKLYDSKGELVATQVINPQSAGSTDSTALVHFYGLDPNETYSLQMLRIAGGINDNVGGLNNLGGYTNVQVNSDWTGLVAGKAYEAHVLTTETNTAVNNSNITQGVVGTGYNDHFYATLGNDKYNGAGGWKTSIDGTKTWVADGGQDVLDYSSINGQVDINVVTGVATKVINGVSYTDTFENIEQFVAAKGNTTFTGDTFDNTFVGGTGNDVFNIASGGSDTIVLNLLDDTNVTGGNGSDVINGFHIGKVGTDSHADIINIHDLLDNYAGTANLYKDTDSLKLDIASSDLNKYLQVTNDGTNTYVKVDLNGTGHDYATVLTLHDVKTDLLTLLANNQLVI